MPNKYMVAVHQTIVKRQWFQITAKSQEHAESEVIRLIETNGLYDEQLDNVMQDATTLRVTQQAAESRVKSDESYGYDMDELTGYSASDAQTEAAAESDAAAEAAPEAAEEAQTGGGTPTETRDSAPPVQQ